MVEEKDSLPDVTQYFEIKSQTNWHCLEKFGVLTIFRSHFKGMSSIIATCIKKQTVRSIVNLKLQLGQIGAVCGHFGLQGYGVCLPISCHYPRKGSTLVFQCTQEITVAQLFLLSSLADSRNCIFFYLHTPRQTRMQGQ